MDYSESHDIIVGGLRFRDMADLEDFCCYFPEFEDVVTEAGLLYAPELQAQVDSYYISAEMEYGDGNVLPGHRLAAGWYGEAVIDEDG